MTQALGTVVLARPGERVAPRPQAGLAGRGPTHGAAAAASAVHDVRIRLDGGRSARASRREALGLLLLTLAAHAALLATWRGQGHEQAPRPHEQQLELVHPAIVPPPPVPEPPPPAPPPRRLQVAPPPPAGPALRTPAAEPDVPQAPTVPENTRAAPGTGPVVAAMPEPPAPQPQAEEPVVEANANAAYLKNPAPAYPAAALRRGLQGTVLLRVHVLPDGHADSVDVKQSSGYRMLDDAALDAVRRWTFVPAMRGKTALAGWATVPIEFKLAN